MKPAPFNGASREKPTVRPRAADVEQLARGQQDRPARLNERETRVSGSPTMSPQEREVRPTSRDSLAQALRLNRREVFKQMVVAQLDAGFLRYSTRQALMEYAGRIGISQFDATLLMAEAQFYADRIPPLDEPCLQTSLVPAIDEGLTGGSESFASRFMFAGAVALLIDLLLVYWLIS